MARKKTSEEISEDFEILQEKKQADKQKEKCADCEKHLAKVEEYKNLLQLTQADFDNYRKRSYTLMQNAKTDGELNVIMRFLPALDSFVKAKEMISDKTLLKGVEMIEKDIKESLKSLGVKETNPKGDMFDPQKHNAISVSNNEDLEDDIITDVYQNGYTYKDKVIRYAQVIINKKS